MRPRRLSRSGLAPVDLAQAAVLEPAAVALRAVRRSGLRKGDIAAVIGLGPVGLLICSLLRLRGVDAVIGTDPVAERRDQASATGAAVLAAGSSADTSGRIWEFTGGTGVDAAFEVVGIQASFLKAVGSGPWIPHRPR